MSKTTRQPAVPARAASAVKPEAAERGAGKAMNRVDLVAAVAQEADLAKTKAGEVVDAVFKAISGALQQGRVMLRTALEVAWGNALPDWLPAAGFTRRQR